ncbi:hypothetical protein BX616_001196 [Lobosporangium transversale]|nr:hypothetical protein BX616_001196 [Lobosporangium transversale]
MVRHILQTDSVAFYRLHATTAPGRALSHFMTDIPLRMNTPTLFSLDTRCEPVDALGGITRRRVTTLLSPFSGQSKLNSCSTVLCNSISFTGRMKNTFLQTLIRDRYQWTGKNNDVCSGGLSRV